MISELFCQQIILPVEASAFSAKILFQRDQPDANAIFLSFIFLSWLLFKPT
jgi:hypothetical protein